MERHETGKALVDLCEQIADLQLELGEVRVAETHARADAISVERESSATQQRLSAERASSSYVGERHRLEADLGALLAGRDLLQFLIKYRLEGVIDANSSLLQAR
ncbi:MAG: hypothetical protein ACR2NL_05095 [Acidimicrobiia bacterium]